VENELYTQGQGNGGHWAKHDLGARVRVTFKKTLQFDTNEIFVYIKNKMIGND
jgi:hypothetical protein